MRTENIFSPFFSPPWCKKQRICGRGDKMFKIKSSEKIFSFFHLPCWKKLGVKIINNFAAVEKK